MFVNNVRVYIMIVDVSKHNWQSQNSAFCQGTCHWYHSWVRSFPLICLNYIGGVKDRVPPLLQK